LLRSRGDFPDALAEKPQVSFHAQAGTWLKRPTPRKQVGKLSHIEEFKTPYGMWSHSGYGQNDLKPVGQRDQQFCYNLQTKNIFLKKLEDAFVKKRMSPPLLRITVNGNRNGNGDKIM
jgi:hypothetical protein